MNNNSHNSHDCENIKESNLVNPGFLDSLSLLENHRIYCQRHSNYISELNDEIKWNKLKHRHKIIDLGINMKNEVNSKNIKFTAEFKLFINEMRDKDISKINNLIPNKLINNLSKYWLKDD